MPDPRLQMMTKLAERMLGPVLMQAPLEDLDVFKETVCNLIDGIKKQRETVEGTATDVTESELGDGKAA